MHAGQQQLSLRVCWPRGVLQGGPGCSSLFGTFYLNGPFQLQTDMTLRQNPGRWNRQYGMLFVDQPIGTGFSVAGGSAAVRLDHPACLLASDNPSPHQQASGLLNPCLL